jgi:hypothetical protein
VRSSRMRDRSALREGSGLLSLRESRMDDHDADATLMGIDSSPVPGDSKDGSKDGEN